MAHVDVARHQHGLHRVGQVQQAQQVAGGAARAAHSLRGQFVSEPKLLDQALQALGFFQRVEVFALDVFDQRHGGGGSLGTSRTSTGTLSSPASLAARKRRSPAMISYLPIGVTRRRWPACAPGSAA
jgi:hypothetical protein